MTDHAANATAAAQLREMAARWVDPAVPMGDCAGRVLTAGDLTLDLQRQRMDPAVIEALGVLGRQCDVAGAARALFAGRHLNISEDRAALHAALRARPDDGHVDVTARDQAVAGRSRCRSFVEAVHAGERVAADGQPFTAVLNIGIGGSDLGPRLVVDALAGLPTRLKAGFCGNIDADGLRRTLAGLDPARTLVIVTTKSFSTLETRLCADRVAAWLGPERAAVHMIAVTASAERAAEHGFSADRVFPLWDWVGGRYSLWSAVGLVIALTYGWDVFAGLLDGARTLDRHIVDAPIDENLPLAWALTGVWNRSFLGYSTNALAVYCERLELLPGWLQQLEMESNGKRVDRHGQVVDHATAAVVWGGVGTSVQHAFFQQLHQGPDVHPVDFVLPLEIDAEDRGMQNALIANAVAQSEGLMTGRSAEHLAAELDRPADDPQVQARVCPGGRPSALLSLPRLTPATIGQLLAAFEHRTFYQGWLWGLNSFDQWGVQLGKVLATRAQAALDGEAVDELDPITQAQIARVRAAQTAG